MFVIRVMLTALVSMENIAPNNAPSVLVARDLVSNISYCIMLSMEFIFIINKVLYEYFYNILTFSKPDTYKSSKPKYSQKKLVLNTRESGCPIYPQFHPCSRSVDLLPSLPGDETRELPRHSFSLNNPLISFSALPFRHDKG